MSTTSFFQTEDGNVKSVEQAKKHPYLIHLNLNKELEDPENLIHQYVSFRDQKNEFDATLIIMDLKNIYMSENAKKLLSKEYLNPLMLLRDYATQYKEKLISTITRGKNMGLIYFESTANEYHFISKSGIDFTVIGVLAFNEKETIRQVHILTDLDMNLTVPIDDSGATSI